MARLENIYDFKNGYKRTFVYKPRPSRKFRDSCFYCMEIGHHVDERPMLKQS
jgi:hypothetical protein